MGKIIVTVLIISIGLFLFRFLGGIAPVATETPQKVINLLQEKEMLPFPLSIPGGLNLTLFAKNLGGPRVITFDSTNTPLVSIPSSKKVVALPDTDNNGESDQEITVAEDLNQPHGLAFSGNNLYIAETDKVSIFDYNPQTKKGTFQRKIIDLPSGGGHSTRTILIHENKLYISIGSSCNVCREVDARRAAVFISELDGSNFRPFATGLRNSVFLRVHPATQKIWATDMGRDHLGDDTPPDEVNILEEGKNYGWPFCYGKAIHDKNFDTTKADFCTTTIASQIDLQAHSAPLGLDFIPNSWPKEMQGDLLIAYHGSWNRSTPTGYKIVKVDSDGKSQDFITGWLSNQKALGRPVDIVFNKDGRAFISDDSAGIIYTLSP